MFVVRWLTGQGIQILSCMADGDRLYAVPVNTARMPCCSQPAAKTE